MRKIFLALTVMLVAFTSAFAQVKEGKLIFERNNGLIHNLRGNGEY